MSLNLPDIHYAPVALDTETTGLYPDEGARITTISAASEGWADVWDVRGWKVADWAEFHDWATQQRLIFQNAKFDMHMFLRGSPDPQDYERQLFWDTKEATGLLWPVGPKIVGTNHVPQYTTSLKPVSEWLWGAVETEEKRRLDEFLKAQPKKLQKRYDLVPWNIHAPYAKQDAILTYRLWEKQVEDWSPELWVLMDRELRLETVLYRMETRGIGFDVEKGREVAGALRHSLQELATQLPVRPTRDQMVKYWWEDHELAPDWLPRTEKQEKVQLSEYVMWKLVNMKLPYAQQFRDYLQIKDALSRWYDDDAWLGKVGPDGRLRVDYQQNGAMTGRLSGRRVNLQAIPRNTTLSKHVPSVRKLFVPKAGCQLWAIDLSQAELRVATAISKCKLARHYIESGMDMHGETAKKIFRVTESSPDWEKDRYISKTINFAVLYAAGVDQIVSTIVEEGKIEFSAYEAQKILRQHRELYPEYHSETERALHKAKERGYLTTVSGRRIYFQPWERRFYKAFNNITQGNVAEVMKDIMIWIEWNYPNILLLQIHDEVVLEVPTDNLKIIYEIAQHIEEFTSDIFHIRMKADVKEWK